MSRNPSPHPRSTAYPGFAVYHEGPNLVAVVSTGEEVWHLSVTGIIMNRTWVNIGITWNKPNLEDTSLPVEKLGGLEMYINQEKVGSTLLPEFTDDSKQVCKRMHFAQLSSISYNEKLMVGRYLSYLLPKQD